MRHYHNPAEIAKGGRRCDKAGDECGKADECDKDDECGKADG
jgi:hypothetical protein